MLATLARLVTLSLLLAAVPAGAQTYNSGSTGADGAYSPTSNQSLQLPASGVFNFTTVNIPQYVTVTIVKNAANTPVTMLATGNVTIAGTLNIAGANGSVTANGGGTGGPGGFNGGVGGGVQAFQSINYNGLPGDGPGGGGGGLGSPDGSVVGGGGGGGFAAAGNSGAYHYFNATGPNDGAGGPFYGAASLLELIGGSGGGGGGSVGGQIAGGGGGGGGAIVLASSGTISFTSSGVINAYGGQGGTTNPGGNNYLNGGGGAGGAVRLVATTLAGNPTINVSGGQSGINYWHNDDPNGNGGSGFARFEAYNFNVFLPTVYGTYESGLAPSSVNLPSPPALQITSVAGVAAPAVPKGDFNSPPDITLPTAAANPAPVAIAAVNIPVGTVVTVQMTPQTGAKTYTSSSPLAGTAAASTASASVQLPASMMSVLIASAVINLGTVQPSVKHAQNTPPLLLNGETVTKIEVAAAFGGGSQVTYVTESGKRYTRGELLGKTAVRVGRK